MKTSYFIKKAQAFLIAIAIAFTLVNCNQDDNFSREEISDLNRTVAIENVSYQEHILYAGQNINIGHIYVSIVDQEIKLTYNITEDGWELTETHLWVGDTSHGYPQTNNGNPKIGQFPYKSGDITGLTSYTYTIPLSDFGIDINENCEDFILYFAAHAAVRKLDENGGEVIQTETAWGDGYDLVEKGNWATGFMIEFTCTEEPDDEDPTICETAFAYGGENNCFLDIDLNEDGNGDFNRWGWFIDPINTIGVTSYPIYAGAAQCDTNKGTFVGTLTIDYQGNTVTVSYDMITPYVMTETHLYIGTEKVPHMNNNPTVAPGQYNNMNNIDNATSDTYVINIQPEESYYFIAHAVVCGF